VCRFNSYFSPSRLLLLDKLVYSYSFYGLEYKLLKLELDNLVELPINFLAPPFQFNIETRLKTKKSEKIQYVIPQLL
jgi:hypothetical protein